LEVKGILVVGKREIPCNVQGFRQRAGEPEQVSFWVMPEVEEEERVPSCLLRVGSAVATVSPVGQWLVRGEQVKLEVTDGLDALRQALDL
jgi:hypothetical protein